MNKKKAIPENYMTVGELAKKMGTTVRTLQYYDKEGLLSPTTESDPSFPPTSPTLIWSPPVYFYQQNFLISSIFISISSAFPISRT